MPQQCRVTISCPSSHFSRLSFHNSCLSCVWNNTHTHTSRTHTCYNSIESFLSCCSVLQCVAVCCSVLQCVDITHTHMPQLNWIVSIMSVRYYGTRNSCLSDTTAPSCLSDTTAPATHVYHLSYSSDTTAVSCPHHLDRIHIMCIHHSSVMSI